MTTQEAIEAIERFRSLAHGHAVLAEALDMAIDALKSQERQELIVGSYLIEEPSCSEEPNRSEPKTSDSGSVDSEQPEIKTDRTMSGDLISRSKAIRWVKAECNPYGQPTLDYESGIKVIEHLERMSSVHPEKSTTAEKSQLAEEKSTRKLIYLDDAIDAMGKAHFKNYGNAIIVLKDLPSALPETSEWIEKEVYHKEENKMIEDWQSAKCKKCGRYHTTPYMYYFQNYEYCPHCGRKMRGGEDEWIERARGMACFHGETWYKCPHCGMAFEVFEAVYECKGIKKTDEKGVYVCSCGKKFMLC